MGWDVGLGNNYRHWVEKYSQEGTLWHTESRCNGFIRTEKEAQRKWARTQLPYLEDQWDLVSGTRPKPGCYNFAKGSVIWVGLIARLPWYLVLYIELKFSSHEDAIGPKPEIRLSIQERWSGGRRHGGGRVLEPDDHRGITQRWLSMF